MKKKVKQTRARLLDGEMAANGYVSAAKASELLRMVPSTVHRLCEEKKLEHVRIGGDVDGRMARIYVKRESLREYLGAETAKILKV